MRFNLAGKVAFPVAFLKASCAAPDVVCTFVGLAALKFGNDAGFLFLLLGQVLLEGKGVVLLLFLVATAALGFFVANGLSRGGFVGRRCIPTVTAASGSVTRDTPVVGVGIGFLNGIISSCLFYLEFGVAIVTTPGLMDLFARIAETAR